MTLQTLTITNPTHVETTCSAYALTKDEFNELHRQSTTAQETAYCPYSHFRVGAALLTAPGGRYITGANIENVSYPVGTCAERVALARAVMEGHRSFRAVAVTTDAAAPCSPCGMCRQFIREFCEPSMPILMFAKNGDFIATKLEVLLPLAFGPSDLESGVTRPEPPAV